MCCNRDNNLPLVALQLYTVRDALARNPSETLKTIEKTGYRYVEIADTGNYSLSEFVSLIKECGLSPISTHVDYLVLVQSPDTVLRESLKSGLKYVVVPWIGPEIWQDVSLSKEIISNLDKMGEKFSSEGISLCYHNHAHEIANPEGINVLDLLIENTEKVYLELDLGWVYVATGKNPLEFAKRYRDRIRLLHLKDVAVREPVRFTELGKGEISWSEVLPAIWELNKSPWIVEQDDNFSEDCISSAKVGLNTIHSILSRL